MSVNRCLFYSFASHDLPQAQVVQDPDIHGWNVPAVVSNPLACLPDPLLPLRVRAQEAFSETFLSFCMELHRSQSAKELSLTRLHLGDLACLQVVQDSERRRPEMVWMKIVLDGVEQPLAADGTALTQVEFTQVRVSYELAAGWRSHPSTSQAQALPPCNHACGRLRCQFGWANWGWGCQTQCQCVSLKDFFFFCVLRCGMSSTGPMMAWQAESPLTLPLCTVSLKGGEGAQTRFQARELFLACRTTMALGQPISAVRGAGNCS